MNAEKAGSNVDIENPFNNRELGVIRDADFFRPYVAELKELFTALGKEDYWSDDPREVVAKIQNWIGGEHGNSAEKDQFSAGQTAAALSVLDTIGLSGELLPPAEAAFDDVLLIAGTTTANYRRTKLIKEALGSGMAVDRIFITAGQRPREARDGTDAELLSPDGRFAGHDITDRPWVRHLQDEGVFNYDGLDSSDPAKQQRAWAFSEVGTARLALEKIMDLQAGQIHLQLIDDDRHVPTPRPDVPARLITNYVYETANEQSKIIVMNATAVDRGTNPKTGEPNPSRHTTASVIVEWLNDYDPPQKARVLFVTGNPHSLRTTQDAYTILKEKGRGDIELVVAGTTPAANTPIQTYLGEIARLVANDVRRNY